MKMADWLTHEISLYSGTSTPLTGPNRVVDRWEIINEPDISAYWPQGSSLTSTLNSYMTNALIPAYDTLHPLGAEVVGAALGSSTGYNNDSPATLKAVGYANYVDYLNIHPYGTTVANHEAHVATFISDFTDAGVSSPEKPVVATEWNWKPSSGTSDADWITGLNQIEANDAPLFDTLYYYRFGDDDVANNYDHKAGLVDPTTTTTDGGETIYVPNSRDSNGYYNAFKAWTNSPTPPANTLTPSDDTYAFSGSTTQTYGSDSQIEVKKSSSGTNDRQAYLKFNIASLPAGASNIILRLHGELSQAETGGLGLTVNQVASTSWSESTLDWANRPTPSSQIGSTQTLASTSDTEVDFDVTSYVQAAKAAGQTSVSLTVLPTSTATLGRTGRPRHRHSL